MRQEQVAGFDRFLTSLGVLPGIPGAKLRQGKRWLVRGARSAYEATQKAGDWVFRKLDNWMAFDDVAEEAVRQGLREGTEEFVEETAHFEIPRRPIGFTDDAVASAYQGMRSRGGHAMRHFIDEGLIPNTGSLASRAQIFEDLTSPILRSPSHAFDWRVGDTLTRAFAGEVAGRNVVVFVAKEGPYQGRVLSAVVPDASQLAQWGLR